MGGQFLKRPVPLSGDSPRFGARRIYYNNFAAHLLNAYSPNMLYPGLPYAWTDEDWQRALNMVAAFGYNVWEFWLVPRLFCREAFRADYGQAFIRRINAAIAHAHAAGLKAELLCSLATVGPDWRTYCPNRPGDWREVRGLWDAWTRALPEVDIVGIFPGDPGACSRNGCTAETYIDKAAEIAALVKRNLPSAELELHTWGPPFFGWGVIQGPKGWQGEFVQSYQHTAWTFDRGRAERSMRHLLDRLPDFPAPTSVAINMGFNPDGNPEGAQDARAWCRELARRGRVHSWDFSLTEGENNVVPHYRLARLFERRRTERDCGAFSGGICFTMSPRLNQLSLFASARSFLDPDADPDAVACEFYVALFGPEGRELVPFLHLFEVVRDWGNYHGIDLSRDEYHARLAVLVELLRDLKGQEREDPALFPRADEHRRELLFFAELFAALSGPAPDYDLLYRRYWDRVYRIYDMLPEHVDPRPRAAAARLIRQFAGDAWQPQGAVSEPNAAGS